MKITVKNWDKYNGNRRHKTSQWFKVSNDIFEDPCLYQLSPSGFKVWLWLLSRCSKSASSRIKCDLSQTQVVLKLRSSLLLRSLKLLESHGLIFLEKESRSPRLDKIREDKREDKIRVSRGSATAPDPDLKSKSSLVWLAYKNSYLERYGTEPVRNAKVNGQIAQLVARLGEEAEEVVKFFVKHNNGFYLQKVHDIGLCLSDAEALRTQMVRKQPVTAGDVRAFEKQDYHRAQAERLKV